MNAENLYNPLDGFDYEILNDSEFKEDAVREEIITPLLKALGYSASGKNKIIRSRKLEHPFVSIGSARKQISLVPDYLMQANNINAWILEAKAPTESVIKSAHVEQAYSYAIHSEIRVKYFGLCNGKEFALYAVGEAEMLICNFKIQALPRYWKTIKDRLSPENIHLPTPKFKKDLGLHLKRLGFNTLDSFFFYKVLASHVARLDNDHFCFSSNPILDQGEEYCATFDFDLVTATQLKGLIPTNGFDALMQPFKGSPQTVVFADADIFLNVQVDMGDMLAENKDEIFLPLRLTKFLP